MTDFSPAPKYSTDEKMITLTDDNGYAHEITVKIESTHYAGRLDRQYATVFIPKGAEFTDLEYDVLQRIELYNYEIKTVQI